MIDQLTLEFVRTLFHPSKKCDLAYATKIVTVFAVCVVINSTVLAETHEQLVLKETNYLFPSDAVFVSTNGNDLGDGSRSNPLRTLSKAINFSSHGDTIVIRKGTYREALPDLSKRLTIQPYPRERVWLKGSRIVSGWVVDGKYWRKDNWTQKFCNTCFHPDNIDPAYPNAGLPDQVFIDGKPLKQVKSRSAVTKGTFFADYKLATLLIGSSPKIKIVEVSIRHSALNIWQGGEGTIIRGLGFAHYSPIAESGLGGTVKANADNLTFENNTFAWSAVKGLVVFAKNARIRGNTFIYNGMMGLGAWRASGLRVIGNRFAFNNQEMFVQTGDVSEAAGAKITATRNLLVTDNQFEGNFCNRSLAGYQRNQRDHQSKYI